jgi:hypothetical protein
MGCEVVSSGGEDQAASQRPAKAVNTDAARIDIVQLASEGSFPASDPPAWTTGREKVVTLVRGSDAENRAHKQG